MSNKQRFLISGEIRKYLKKLPIDLIIFAYSDKEFCLELVTDKVYEKFRDSRNPGESYMPDMYTKVVHPNDVANLRNIFLTANLANGEQIYADVRLKPMSDHRYRWYRVSIFSQKVKDEDYLIYVSLMNINELQIRNDNQEAKSEQNESLLDTVLNTTQVPIFWKDKNRRFLGANEAFRNYYGFTRDEDFIGKNDEEMNWHPDPVLFKDDEENVLQGDATYMVHGKCMQGNELRDILATKNPLYQNGEVVGLVGSFMDITENYRRESEISALNEKLNAALESERRTNQSINEFLSRMSHEIRTPMNAIMGLAELTLHKTDDPEICDVFRKIRSSCTYLLGIVNDILDIRKVEGGNVSLVVARNSIDEFVEDIRLIIDPLAEEKEIQFSVIDKNITERLCIADKQRVEQILVNLLSNAIKFTDPHGHVELIISQELSKNDMEMIFTVKDNGCGISPLFLQKIFRPFAQENRDVVRYGTGTGLGLTIAKRFAVLMKGDITVESVEGFGSTFVASMRLGRCAEDKVVPEKQKETGTDMVVKLKGRRVLLVEDNAINIEVAQGILNEVGITVDCATDGAMGCNMYEKSAPGFYDAILMDLQMPIRDGFEATRIIRAMDRKDAANIPIVAMSADVFEESMRKAINMGMDGYISKPINIQQLYQTLNRLL